MRNLKTLVVAVAVVCAAQSISLAGTKRIQFRNATGEPASALQIEFSMEFESLVSLMPMDAFAMHTGDGSTILTIAQDTGFGIADGETLAIEIEYEGLEAPTVNAARWSRTNTLTPENTDWIGSTLSQVITNIDFIGDVAYGDGTINIDLDGVTVPFSFVPGETALAAAERFGDAIDDHEQVSLLSVEDGHVFAVCDLLGDGIALEIAGYPDDGGITINVYTSEIESELFLRGDSNGSGDVTALFDAIHLLRWGFVGGATPPCLRAADVDGNDEVQPMVDALYLLRFRFSSGEAPPAPGPDECGTDRGSALSCETPLNSCM